MRRHSQQLLHLLGGDVGLAIGRAQLDGTHVNQNFIATGTGVCGVVVTSSHIYWANCQSSRIGWAKIDDTSVNQNFITGLNGPLAFLAVDSAHIYWAVPNPKNTIGRANLNGTGVNQSFITGTLGGNGIAVTGGSPLTVATDGTHD